MKREATADAIGTHERASATPVHTDHHAPSRHGVTPNWVPRELNLAAQQAWFEAIVTTPESEPAPADEAGLLRLVTPSKELTALERLDVYRRGYYARLVECLVDDYPVLQHALGEEAFEELSHAYIAEHPSKSPSLNYFGRHMADFCRTQPLPSPGFAADLAAIEWAIVLSIHAPTAPTLTSEELATVPGERWPSVCLKANPSLCILHQEYPANAYLQAFRNDADPSVPEAKRTSVAVYRTQMRVWRLELTPPMVTLFEALKSGATLAESLNRVAPELEGTPEAEAVQMVMHWFRTGVSSGLFSGLYFA